MKFKFKPFYIDTNAYFGEVLHDDSCDELDDRYFTSFKRALHHLSERGNSSFEVIFNKLTYNPEETGISGLPMFSFKPKEHEKSLFSFLTEIE